MAEDFDKEAAYAHQDKILNRVRDVRNSINQNVIDYYASANIDSEEKFKENMQGIHRYLRDAYNWIGQILNDVEYYE